MPNCTLYIPEDLIVVESATKLGCSDSDTHIYISERRSPTLTGAKIMRIWSWNRKEMDVKSGAAIVLQKKEDKNCYFAIRTDVKLGERIHPTEQSNVETDLPKVDIGMSDREMEVEMVKDKKEQEKISNDAQEDTCTPPLLQDKEAEHVEECSQELEKLCQAWQNIQTQGQDKFEDAEEMIEKLEKPKQEKHIWRRSLNWLNEVLKERNAPKIARMSKRELEEGRQLYRTSFMTRPMIQAQRERQKRQQLVFFNSLRQRVKNLLDAHWEIQKQKEERYEKWMAGHGMRIPESSLDQLKKRMSKWEKRFLKVKEYFTHKFI